MSSNKLTFLSEEWVRHVVATIERAKSTNESIKALASEFSLSVAYIINGLPKPLKELYNSDSVAIYIELNHGVIKRFVVGAEAPKESSPDFTVESDYIIAKKIFLGEINPASAFIKRYIKVKPLMKLYMDPSFTAKSITIANMLRKAIETVPTVFPE
jgi:putative sterol carrier protein